MKAAILCATNVLARCDSRSFVCVVKTTTFCERERDLMVASGSAETAGDI